MRKGRAVVVVRLIHPPALHFRSLAPPQWWGFSCWEAPSHCGNRALRRSPEFHQKLRSPPERWIASANPQREGCRWLHPSAYPAVDWVVLRSSCMAINSAARLPAKEGLLLERGFGARGVCGGAGLNGQSAHPAAQQPRWLVFIGRAQKPRGSHRIPCAPRVTGVRLNCQDVSPASRCRMTDGLECFEP